MSHKSEKQAMTAWEEEVQRLATQLEQQRPLTQRAPRLFKQELRQKLLTQYDQPALSWQDWGNLWRFAGTAVTLIFLFVAAGWAWTTFSQQSTQTSTNSQQEGGGEVVEANHSPVPLPTSTPIFFGSVENMPVELGDNIWLTAVEYNDTSFLPNETLEVTLTWEAIGQPSTNYTAFINLLDTQGKSISQVNIPLGDTFNDGTSISKQFTFLIPNEQAVGNLGLQTGLYNPLTGAQIPQSSFWNTLDLGLIQVVTAVTQFAIVSRTNGNGLTLYNVPNEHTPSILTLEAGDVLIITHEPTVEHNGSVWQQVTTSTGQIGWVVTDFIQLLPQSEPTEVAAPEELQDTLEILSISPPVGTIITQTTRFEVNIAYNLETERKAEINVMFGPNDGSGVAMFYGFESVTQGAGELQITFELNPAIDMNISTPIDLILLANMGQYTSSGGTTFVSMSPQTSLDDAYHYQP